MPKHNRVLQNFICINQITNDKVAKLVSIILILSIYLYLVFHALLILWHIIYYLPIIDLSFIVLSRNSSKWLIKNNCFLLANLFLASYARNGSFNEN